MAVAVGNEASADTHGTSIGANAKTTGYGAFAGGVNAQANGVGAIAIGGATSDAVQSECGRLMVNLLLLLVLVQLLVTVVA